jgi:predicted transcriptional regulator
MIETMYDRDPRVDWQNDSMAYLPQVEGNPWTVVAIDGLWYAFDDRGERVSDVAGPATVDEALHEVIGNPMWMVEGHLIMQAAPNTGIVSHAYVHEHDNSAEAMNYLVEAGVFTVVDDSEGSDYVLTDAGRALAELAEDMDEQQGHAYLDDLRDATALQSSDA